MSFQEFYTSRISSVILAESAKKENIIFVLLAQADLFDTSGFRENLVDESTFFLEGNETIFDREWFTRTFTKLQLQQDYHILSYPQFSYLLFYIEASFFSDRIIIVRDNVRQLFPIRKENFLEESEEGSIDVRPETLPIYQAEQLQAGNSYFYSIRMPSDDFEIIPVFNEEHELADPQGKVAEVIDVSSDPYALDIFFNSCITDDDFTKQAVVKIYRKQPLNESLLKNVGYINHILLQFGGSLFSLQEDDIQEDYQVDENTVQLLKQYWGEDASFRGLKIYRNPDVNNEISEISQGLIVDTIIQEYEKASQDEKPRDLFLTAPTGAGKSLLFQLPAFYVSSKNDVTIVVSPLIALMTDQVNAIISERCFEKVAYLNSELSLIDRDNIIEKCKNGAIDILYLSPELLLSYDITHFIGSRRLGLLVIDEAHLITTWGRDFRVDYWFLGNHVRKIRKYHSLNFPMVAVTATAVYGGSNDMVFDSVDSLAMHDPHLFIGQVKRDDITFLINNHESFAKNYRRKKTDQTVDFIKKISEVGLKALIYTPYAKHIRDILQALQSEQLDIAVGYHGRLPSQQKEFAFGQFKSGEKKIMVCTKAFGMGVDISDIELVYHHAPSGLLPDYVQEIGRVARKPEIKGFAALNYSNQDQGFAKALYGMSALRQHQIKEVLKKIFKAYLKSRKSRNLLLSVDDFGYIFEDAKDVDQKVLTALMMIEKDYLAKHRFNVLIARPKKLFVKVFARVSNSDWDRFQAIYPNTSLLLETHENGNHIIEIDLDRLWYENFDERSFAKLKYEFYSQSLFRADKINIIPQLKISFELSEQFEKVHQSLDSLFQILRNVFSKLSGSYFDSQQFQMELNAHLNDEEKSEKICKLILSSYSGRLIEPRKLEGNAFLQQRWEAGTYKYTVYNNRYLANFSALRKKLSNLFANSQGRIASRYVTNAESNAVHYVRLGYFLEMLELGTFEIKGGEKPMVFIRINDPSRIEKDAYRTDYQNSLLTRTRERHDLSNQIFDHFFSRRFSNDERWDFIEDFFLGSDVDVLLDRYKGGETNNIDIIDYLRQNSIPIERDVTSFNSDTQLHLFPPNPEDYYHDSNLLTIKEELEERTMRVSEWLAKDPVAFHKVFQKHKLKLNSNVFEILISKLRADHPQYFKESLGLNLRINFRGFDTPVKAVVPYKNTPVQFYKWWYENQQEVHMTFQEKLRLFIKVDSINGKALRSEHKKIISR